MADAAAFDELYRAARDRLTVQLAAVTGDRAEAMDHVQEAFVRAWMRWERVGDYDDPEGWVRRVAYNLAVSRWRRLRRIVLHADVPVPEVDREQEPDDVLAALMQLPARQRRALSLHYLADLSLEQIAAEMGSPIGTVKSLLSRGRTRLADVLARGDEFSDERS